jgi:hypothetical protein
MHNYELIEVTHEYPINVYDVGFKSFTFNVMSILFIHYDRMMKQGEYSVEYYEVYPDRIRIVGHIVYNKGDEK